MLGVRYSTKRGGFRQARTDPISFLTRKSVARMEWEDDALPRCSYKMILCITNHHHCARA
jgi:hypothetical protein